MGVISSKENNIIGYVRCVVLLIVGIILLSSGVAQTSLMSKEPVDLESRSFDWLDIESGDHVKFDMSNCLGGFWEVTTNNRATKRIYGYANSGSRVYNYDYIIGVTVSSTNFDKIQELIDDTERYIKTGTPIDARYEVDGRIRKMSKDEYNALMSNLKQAGYSEEEAREIILPYVVDLSSGGPTLLIIGGIVTLAGVIMLVGTIIKNRKGKNIETEGLRIFD